MSLPKNIACRTVLPLPWGKKSRKVKLNQFLPHPTTSPCAAKTLLYSTVSAALSTVEVFKINLSASL